MRTQSVDTSSEVERVQIELIRQAPFAKIFDIVVSMSETLTQASRNNLRRLHPEMSEEEIAILFVELNYGKDLAKRVQQYIASRKKS